MNSRKRSTPNNNFGVKLEDNPPVCQRDHDKQGEGREREESNEPNS